MNTLFTGHPIIELASTDSTNTYAIELVKNENVNEGAVFWAKEQTGGRGQRNNVWISEAGKNLTFSLVLKPFFMEAAEQFVITKVISLAIADYLSDALKDKPHDRIAIKWPNDIYIGDKKIGGILIENIIRNNKLAFCIAGIGLNMNQKSFGKDISNAVSLTQITGNELDLKKELEDMCSYLEARYLQLKTGKNKLLDVSYETRLYKLNEMSAFTAADKTFEGKITGVTEEGLLIVEMKSGERKEFRFKEIQLSN